MKRTTRRALSCLPLALILAPPLAAQGEYAAAAMRGISNEGRHRDQPYVTAGDRAYLIGTQDGGFPDMGQHTPGEMGGLWLQPIKLADGFWATVRDESSGRERALREADELVTYPYGTRVRYGAVLDGLELERLQYSPDGHAGIVVRYQLRNSTGRARPVTFLFTARTDLSPVWYSDRLGIEDAPDTVAWRRAERAFVARDTGHEWFVVWGASGTGEARPVAASSVPRTSGRGATATSRHRLTVPPRSTATLTFVFAGSASGEAEAVRAYRDLARNPGALLERKEQRSAALLQRARVTIPSGVSRRSTTGCGSTWTGWSGRCPASAEVSPPVCRSTRGGSAPRPIPCRPSRRRAISRSRWRRCACSGATRTAPTATAGSSTRSPAPAGS